MTSKTDLIGQALDRYGFFVRVSDPEECEIGFGASYVDDHTTAAIGTTRTLTGSSYSVTVLPAGSRLRVSPPPPPEYPVDVYLDGAFLWRGAWQRDLDDIWLDARLVSLHTSINLDVVIRSAGHPDQLPKELTLTRDHPTPTRSWFR